MAEIDSPITLRSHDHHDMLAGGLWELFQSKRGVDLDIGCDMSVHQCVLDVFLSKEKLLLGGSKLSPPKSSLKSLLEFLYTGKVTVHVNQLATVLETAKDCGFWLLVDTIAKATHMENAGGQQSVPQSPNSITLAQSPNFLPATIEISKVEERRLIRSRQFSISQTTNVARYCELRNLLRRQTPGSGILPDTNEDAVSDGSLVFANVEIKQEPQEVPDDIDDEPGIPFDIGSCLLLQLSESGLEKTIEMDDELLETPHDEANRPSISNGTDHSPAEWCGAQTRMPDSPSQVAAADIWSPHVCSECGRTFVSKSNLKIHLKIHTGEKPFRCETCGKLFGNKSHMNRHMRSHTGQKPYKCELCQRSFTQRSHLDSHSRTHAALHPFRCLTCGVTFTRSAYLKCHIDKNGGHRSSEGDCSDAVSVSPNI